MSRGPGKTQRAVLDALTDGRLLTIGQIAYRVYDGPEYMTRSQYESLRRAIAGLTIRGDVQETWHSSWLGQQKRFGLPRRVDVVLGLFLEILARAEGLENGGADRTTAVHTALDEWVQSADNSGDDLSVASPLNTTLIDLFGESERGA